MSRYPTNFRYTKDHEWAEKRGEVIRVGITDHAQSALGDVVFVDLPEVGRELSSGASFGVVESIKAVSDLYAPLAGEVVSINSPLKDHPGLLNQKPHDEAWLIEVRPSNPADFNGLMDAGAYETYVKSIS
jgi:glycine cleavage system H protein